MMGEHSCMDTVGYCSTNDCGGACDDLKGSIGFLCCTPEYVPTTTTTTTTAARRPTAPPSESVYNVEAARSHPGVVATNKIMYIDPKLQWGAHVALLAGSWRIRAEGFYQAHNQTTLTDIGDTACNSPLVDNQVFTGWCACNDEYTYGKCKMSLFYNLGAECPSRNNSCGAAIPADGLITTSRAGIVYFQIADTFHDDNNGSVTLTFVKEDDGWRSGAVTSTKTEMTMLLVMVVSLLF